MPAVLARTPGSPRTDRAGRHRACTRTGVGATPVRAIRRPSSVDAGVGGDDGPVGRGARGAERPRRGPSVRIVTAVTRRPRGSEQARRAAAPAGPPRCRHRCSTLHHRLVDQQRRQQLAVARGRSRRSHRRWPAPAACSAARGEPPRGRRQARARCRRAPAASPSPRSAARRRRSGSMPSRSSACRSTTSTRSAWGRRRSRVPPASTTAPGRSSSSSACADGRGSPVGRHRHHEPGSPPSGRRG